MAKINTKIDLPVIMLKCRLEIFQTIKPKKKTEWYNNRYSAVCDKVRPFKPISKLL